MFKVARSCAIRPAACQVVPEVRRLRSSRTTSFPPKQRQVVRHGAADDAASNDDCAGRLRKLRHEYTSVPAIQLSSAPRSAFLSSVPAIAMKTISVLPAIRSDDIGSMIDLAPTT